MFCLGFLCLQDLSIVDSWVYLRLQAFRYKDCHYRYDERSNGPKKSGGRVVGEGPQQPTRPQCRFVEELFGWERGHNNQRGPQSWFVQRKKQRRGFADWLLLGGVAQQHKQPRRTGP